MVAYRRWSTVRELAHPEAYVRRACANLAVSQFRRRMAEVRALRRTGTPQTVEQLGGPDDFWRLVRSLPRRQGQVVALHYVLTTWRRCGASSPKTLSSRWPAPGLDSPWRVLFTSADQLLRRLTDPINQGSSLSTETVNAVRAGDDVMVEQVSTVSRDGDTFVTIVCHIFSVEAGKITTIRTYRNDGGIPAG